MYIFNIYNLDKVNVENVAPRIKFNHKGKIMPMGASADVG